MNRISIADSRNLLQFACEDLKALLLMDQEEREEYLRVLSLKDI